MVLQGFSWSNLEEHSHDVAYPPTFAESRLMAYDCIAHGARGILYWGSSYLKSSGFEAFRESLYALTSELAALQLFLTAPEERYARITVIEGRRRTETAQGHANQEGPPYAELGMRMTARRTGRDWLIILVNEDNKIQMEVAGLDDLNGMEFVLLYGDETVTVNRGEFVTRMMPHEVKLFATNRKWETDRPETLHA